MATRTLRLCVAQYEDGEEGPILFAVGWDSDPEDPKAQDDLRQKDVLKIAEHLSQDCLSAIRFVDVEVPIIEDLTLKATERGCNRPHQSN